MIQISMNAILLFVLGFMCLGCHASKPLYTTNASTFLSQQKIDILETRAQKGDADAANRLFEYYFFNTDDRSLAIKWLSIAATNNNGSAQYNLGMYYSGNIYPDVNDRQSAKYWFGRAQTNHIDQSGQRLLELNRQ